MLRGFIDIIGGYMHILCLRKTLLNYFTHENGAAKGRAPGPA